MIVNLVQCPNCASQVRADRLDRHMSKVHGILRERSTYMATSVLEKCPLCKEQVATDKLSRHIVKDCTRTRVRSVQSIADCVLGSVLRVFLCVTVGLISVAAIATYFGQLGTIVRWVLLHPVVVATSILIPAVTLMYHMTVVAMASRQVDMAHRNKTNAICSNASRDFEKRERRRKQLLSPEERDYEDEQEERKRQEEREQEQRKYEQWQSEWREEQEQEERDRQNAAWQAEQDAIAREYRREEREREEYDRRQQSERDARDDAERRRQDYLSSMG